MLGPLTCMISHGLALTWIIPEHIPRSSPTHQKTLKLQKVTLDLRLRVRCCPFNEKGAFLSYVAYRVTMIRLLTE